MAHFFQKNTSFQSDLNFTCFSLKRAILPCLCVGAFHSLFLSAILQPIFSHLCECPHLRQSSTSLCFGERLCEYRKGPFLQRGVQSMSLGCPQRSSEYRKKGGGKFGRRRKCFFERTKRKKKKWSLQNKNKNSMMTK